MNREATENKSYNTIAPLVDIYEDENLYTIEAEVPGLKKEDLDITIKDRELTISGKISADDKDSQQYKEFQLNNYLRSFNINTDISNNEIEAKLQNGILTVTLPKSEKIKPKKIEVTSLH